MSSLKIFHDHFPDSFSENEEIDTEGSTHQDT